MCDAIPLCCKFSQGIISGEMGCFYILSIFGTCLIGWLPCLVNHFLWITTNSLGTLLQISKGGDFDNAFAFTLYSKIFSPFAKCTPFVAFLNGEYNLNLKGFSSKSTTLSHPFIRCSLIFIFKFFLHDNKYKQTPSYPFGIDYGILKVIIVILHECKFPQKLFCLFSHFLLSSPFLRFPCFLYLIVLLRIMEDNMKGALCLDHFMLVLEKKESS